MFAYSLVGIRFLVCVMAVIKPLKVVIDNYPEDRVEEMEAINNPEDMSMGTRKVPFSRILYIEDKGIARLNNHHFPDTSLSI